MTLPPTEISLRSSLFIEGFRGRSLRLDAAGHWTTLNHGSGVYRATLDGGVVAGKGPAVHRLPDTESDKINALVATTLSELKERLLKEEIDLSFPSQPVPVDQIHNRLDLALKLCETPGTQLKKVYRSTYPEGVPILPPDRYRDVVLQPAQGCPYGKCDFCAFYRDKTFRVWTEDEIDQHLNGVKQVFGEALGNRNGLFLGSASALSLSQRRLLFFMDKVSDFLPDLKRGMGAFLDPDHAPSRDVGQYRQLADRGLRQVTIGLESGCEDLRGKLGKQSKLNRLRNTVTLLKTAGLQVVLTVLVGAGGKDYIDSHRRDTAALLHKLPLSREDIVYLSPLQGSLPASLMTEEAHQLRSALMQSTPARIAPYNMERFFYYR